MTARARLDADRTAEPLTRIEHHPPHGGCISPYMPLVNPEYVDENGKPTPLSASVLATSDGANEAKGDKPFPMPGTVWRWTGDPRFDPRPSGPHVVASLRWFHGQAEAVFADGESCGDVGHMMQSDAWECVPPPHDLARSEVALAKMLAAYLEWHAAEKARYTGDDESVDHMGGALEDEGMLDYPKSAASEKGRALLDRARKAGVL